MATEFSEIGIGATVLLAGAILLGAVYSQKGQAQAKGYNLIASFDRAEGIAIGSNVRLAGINVGRVLDQRLDDAFRAVVTLRIREDVLLPEDTVAAIQTEGLLGSKFIALQPGGDDKNMSPGSQFAYTQGAVMIEELLAKIVDEAKAKRTAPLPAR
jgi:phospholipid/cholesterol/gamma-HCH transport system substrate-binding protein